MVPERLRVTVIPSRSRAILLLDTEPGSLTSRTPNFRRAGIRYRPAFNPTLRLDNEKALGS
jgi:hypothetical protein